MRMSVGYCGRPSSWTFFTGRRNYERWMRAKFLATVTEPDSASATVTQSDTDPESDSGPSLTKARSNNRRPGPPGPARRHSCMVPGCGVEPCLLRVVRVQSMLEHCGADVQGSRLLRNVPVLQGNTLATGRPSIRVRHGDTAT